MWEGKIDKLTFNGAKKLKIWPYCCGCYHWPCATTSHGTKQKKKEVHEIILLLYIHIHVTWGWILEYIISLYFHRFANHLKEKENIG